VVTAAVLAREDTVQIAPGAEVFDDGWKVALQRFKIAGSSRSELEQTKQLGQLKLQIREAMSVILPGLDVMTNMRVEILPNLMVYVFIQPPEGSKTSLNEVLQSLRATSAVREMLQSRVERVKGLEASGVSTVETVQLDMWRRAENDKGEEYFYSSTTGVVSWHLPAYQTEDDEDAYVAQTAFGTVEPRRMSNGSALEEDVSASMVLGFAYGKREVDITFFERPIGMVWFEDDMPIKVCEVRKESLAREAGVKKGYRLTHINYEQVEKGKTYKEVYQLLMDTCNALPQKGDVKLQSEA